MAETERSHGDGTEGVIGRARKFLAACAQYASARLRLASLEGRNAVAHGFKLLLITGAAIVLGAFGWLFACLAIVFLLAKAFDDPNGWVWAALIMAGLHFAGVLALAFALKSKFHTSLFPLTTAELKKDQQWLDQQKTTDRQS
jgi:uncharacterized membrane protein YqjE